MVPNHARYQTALHLGKKNDTTFAFSFQLFCDKYSRKLRYAYIYGNFNDRKAVIIGKKFEYYKKDSEKLFTSRLNFGILVCVTWEHSSAGRASALQAGGHRFEPCCSHHAYAGVAQLVERRLAKAKAAGSSPVSRSNMAP